MRFTYSRATAETLGEQLRPLDSAVEFFALGLHDNYLVSLGRTRYVLRAYRNQWRCEEEILFELELLCLLHDQGVPVAHPVPSKDGSLAVAVKYPEGTRYATLFTYAEGKPADRDLSSRQSRLLGRTAAHLHAVSDRFEIQHRRKHLSLEHLLDDTLDLVRPLLKHRPEDIAYLEAVRDDAVGTLGGLPTTAP
jgi:Ser/Thr protein kinase RdoA (MazF antagonist)